MEISEGEHSIITSGLQEVKVGSLALGLSFALFEARRSGSLTTPDGANETVTFAQTLALGNAASGAYAFGAACSGSRWPDPAAHLADVLEKSMEELPRD